MTKFTRLLQIAAIGAACLLLGCVSAVQREERHVCSPLCFEGTVPSEHRVQAVRGIRPQMGAPISPSGAIIHFAGETQRLIDQGELPLKLVQDTRIKAHLLELPTGFGLARSPTELMEKAQMGVGVIGQIVRTPDGTPKLGPNTASGFFLTEAGALVTCLHVLSPPYVVGLSVMTRDGRVHLVREVIASDAVNDLIILQVDGEGFTPLPLATSNAPPGTAVWVLSHPSWQYYTLTDGIVATYFAAGGQQTEQMTVTADFAVGSSGAPVLNERGEVVGVAKTTKAFKAGAGENDSIQMVTKICTPVAALLNLIRDR